MLMDRLVPDGRWCQLGDSGRGGVPGLEPLDGGALRVGQQVEVASGGGDVRVARSFWTTRRSAPLASSAVAYP